MRFNTAFDVSFSVEHDYDDPFDVPAEVLLNALQRRLDYLKENPQEAKDSFGVCDTYETQEDVVHVSN